MFLLAEETIFETTLFLLSPKLAGSVAFLDLQVWLELLSYGSVEISLSFS